MKFINYTNDGRVVIQHAALILSKLDETDTLELHTMDNAIILLKKDMTLVETRDVLQGMVRLARSMTLDALCNSDAEDKTPLVDESVDDEYEDIFISPKNRNSAPPQWIWRSFCAAAVKSCFPPAEKNALPVTTA